MDFYYRPNIAAQVAAYVNYVCPVQGAKEEMMKIDPGSPRARGSSRQTRSSTRPTFSATHPEEQVQYTEAFGRVIQG